MIEFSFVLFLLYLVFTTNPSRWRNFTLNWCPPPQNVREEEVVAPVIIRTRVRTGLNCSLYLCISIGSVLLLVLNTNVHNCDKLSDSSLDSTKGKSCGKVKLLLNSFLSFHFVLISPPGNVLLISICFKSRVLVHVCVFVCVYTYIYM